eukprot:gnl/MRDRNA2_/MRDRNA2_113734_c0_seq1.p1 gnl/MRDRNA2_/MRDRNA2_113734_c0~~gnl/MRDRNA2_/MRDRNA2_113734_c0_seq1.p1  ORF type:complete len:652 (-),score=97.96 gnl/MRDRNA2_/MRDRNA2_113734_c0_seq1:154-2109(-)
MTLDRESIWISADISAGRFPELVPIVHSVGFETFMALIICVNCMTIGLQVHLCPPPDSVRYARYGESCPSVYVSSSEHVCVVIFLIEFFLRGFSSGFGQYCSSPMMAADACVVWIIGVGCSWLLPLIAPSFGIGNALELRIVTALRAFRLLRLLRVVRFHFKDMWRLFLGMARSAQTLLSMICVVIFVNYIFGILGVVLIGDAPEQDYEDANMYFDGLDQTMFTLVQIITADAWASVIARPIMASIAGSWIFFLAYIAVGMLVLMNLMTAIIVENAMEMAKEDEEAQLHELALRKKKEFDKLTRVFLSLDGDESGDIHEEEFEKAFMTRPDILDKFRLLDFDEKDFKRLFTDLDNGDGVLTTDEFLDGMMRMQGAARAKEVIRVQKNVERLHSQMDTLFNLIDRDGKARESLGMKNIKGRWRKSFKPQVAARRSHRIPTDTSIDQPKMAKSLTRASNFSLRSEAKVAAKHRASSKLSGSQAPNNDVDQEDPIPEDRAKNNESLSVEARAHPNITVLIEQAMDQAMDQVYHHFAQSKYSVIEQTMKQLQKDLQNMHGGAADASCHDVLLESEFPDVSVSGPGGPFLGLTQLEGRGLAETASWDVEETHRSQNVPYGTRALQTYSPGERPLPEPSSSQLEFDSEILDEPTPFM